MITRKIHYYMIKNPNKERVCQGRGNYGIYKATHIVNNVTCRHCLIYMEAGKADVDFTKQQKLTITRKLGSKGFGHGHRSAQPFKIVGKILWGYCER